MRSCRTVARRASVALAVLLLVAASQAALAGTAFAALTPVSTASSIGLFSPDWKTHPARTTAQWQAAARSFAVMVGQVDDYSPVLSVLHAANPALTVLMYNSGPYLGKSDARYAPTLAAHPDWFARDSQGHLITVRQQPNMVLMEQSNPGWRAFKVKEVASKLAAAPFDGVYMDCMGWGPTQGYTTAKPVNPATKRPYTSTEWLQQSVLTLNAVKATAGSRFVMFNGLTSGTSYQTTKLLATSNADGGMAEEFVRTAQSSITAYPTASDWVKNLSMIQDMESRGRMFFGWIKTWTRSTSAQQSAWNVFAEATYLLARGAHSYYSFLPSTGVDRTGVFYPVEQAALGAPLGAYTVAGGVYSRSFQHGTVTVNPGAHTASITVTP